jgi:hypothetical protein
LSNQNRQIPVMDAGDAELIAMHAVLRLLERCARPATVPVLLTALNSLEMATLAAMEGEPDAAENWKALDSLRKQVNDFLKFGTKGRG